MSSRQPTEVQFLQGDTLAELQYTLTDVNGNPVNLINCTVAFTMYSLYTGAIVVNAGTTQILTPAVGLVQYNWQPADVSMAGIFCGRFTVTGGAGGLQNFPPDNSLIINIMPNTANIGGNQGGVVDTPGISGSFGPSS